MNDLINAYKRFRSDISTAAHELELLKEHKFVEEVGEILVEAGELDDFVRSSYKSRGVRVDGYCFDEEFSSLSLVVACWKDEQDINSSKITDTEIETAFKRCVKYFQQSKVGLHERIEIANEAHDLARLIKEVRDDILDVKVILVTDGLAKNRAAEVKELGGVRITHVIWDIERILKFIEKGEKESVVVDFLENEGNPMPCINQKSSNGLYDTYLAFVPAQTLAGMYSRWGTRLLDMNVRVFLSARGKVNRGIRDTIVKEPEMFCAYNNGITGFASKLDFVTGTNGTKSIIRASDFQIINGGQTVASIFHTHKKNDAELSKISVQMKLVVISDPEKIGKFVPRISEYSNTQNRVSLADLAANDPPHPELHDISKRLQAPDPTGGSRLTYWFYEKARGGYEETKNLSANTRAKVREFEAKYPKSQRFDKSIFGKAWNTYLKKPHIVSLGAQKNFANFNLWLKQQEEDLENFFKKTVALVMLWKNAERIIRRQQFQGYRHNIVTYTLAWLFVLTEHRIDLDRLWENQSIDDCLLDAIEGLSQKVNLHIRDTEKNITEWCKKEDCWELLKVESYELPGGIDDTYVVSGGTRQAYNDIIREKEVEVIEFCVSKGSDAWFKLSKWLKERSYLTSKARSQCYNMGRILKRDAEPSERLAPPCKKIWEEAELRGWIYRADNDDSIER